MWFSSCFAMATQSTKKLMAAAETALAGYKRAGFDADPHNPDHIAAYVAMRQFSLRVSPQAFMNSLKNQVKQVTSGAKVKRQYWAVPKVNFPLGLPPDLADCVIAQDQIELMEVTGGGTIDTDTYHILDQQATRQSLGKNVLFLETYLANSIRASNAAAY